MRHRMYPGWREKRVLYFELDRPAKVITAYQLMEYGHTAEEATALWDALPYEHTVAVPEDDTRKIYNDNE
jgi:hypothetical protein